MYAQMEYNTGGTVTAMYKNELEIPAFIDNGASVNVLPEAFMTNTSYYIGCQK